MVDEALGHRRPAILTETPACMRVQKVLGCLPSHWSVPHPPVSCTARIWHARCRTASRSTTLLHNRKGLIMLRALTLALVLTVTPPAPARLAFVQAITEPLFQCDTADAYSQLTLCPQLSTQIANTPIPHQFHGHVRSLATQLRSES